MRIYGYWPTVQPLLFPHVSEKEPLTHSNGTKNTWVPSQPTVHGCGVISPQEWQPPVFLILPSSMLQKPNSRQEWLRGLGLSSSTHLYSQGGSSTTGMPADNTGHKHLGPNSLAWPCFQTGSSKLRPQAVTSVQWHCALWQFIKQGSHSKRSRPLSLHPALEHWHRGLHMEKVRLWSSPQKNWLYL